MSQELPANTQLSHYRVLAKLGAGGMGEVYLAEDTRLRRKVALKVLPEAIAADADRLLRFEREAHAASALNHPNILTIHEFGAVGDRHFLASEYVQGETLRDRLRRGRLSVAETLDVAVQIAAALQAAHDAGIVHRDIKPENVMIRKDGYVKVLDFGLAKLLEQTPLDEEAETRRQLRTEEGLVMGTVAYMSPEQARGQVVDARSDVWSLGGVLYELVTRRQPFEGETVTDVLANIIHQEPPSILTSRQDLPAELDAIIRRALRKDKSERYPSANGLLADLKELQTRLLVEAATGRAPGVETEAETQVFQAAGENTPATRASGTGSIAVLAFANMSADEENEYFCDGLAEELLNALSKIDGLKVAARTSAFTFKGKDVNVSEIGRRLGVNTVLEGSVRKAGNRLRISVQLVNAADGYQLWSERYDREMRDIFDVQDEIALAVVGALKLKLFGDEKAAVLKHYTDNAEAYELYLKGRFFWGKVSPAGFEKAIDFFNQAIAAEPGFALAYAGLADSYAILSQVSAIPVRETMPRAKEYAEKALSLDPGLAEAHTSLGLVLMDYDYDFAGAETHFREAIRLNPSNSTSHQLYGQLLSELGRHEEAAAEHRRALKVDPLSVLANCLYGFGMFESRRYDEALVQLGKTNELDPTFPLTQTIMAYVYQVKGDYSAAVEGFAKFYELVSSAEDAARARESFAQGGWSGYVRMMVGERRPADVTGYLAATLHSSLGEKDAAFGELEKAYADREALLALIKIDPRVDGLRGDPRFAEMLERVGFPPEETGRGDASGETETRLSSSGVAGDDSRARREDSREPANGEIRPKGKWWLLGLLGPLVLVGGYVGYGYYQARQLIDSIAVLPFENRSPDADTEYLSDGLAESLIYRLSQLPGLKVSPTSSAFRHRGKGADAQAVGSDLGVGALMTGRIALRGETLTVSVELVDVRHNRLLWGEQYERKLTDLLATQREIADKIADKLRLKLSGEGERKLKKNYTDNNEAYQLYLKGRYHFSRRSKEDLQKSIAFFQQAINLDPKFALAYAGIAELYATMPLYPYLSPTVAVPQAKAAVVKALELDPELADAHTIAGYIASGYDWDWARAEREFKRAIELDPNLANAHYRYAWTYLTPLGRHAEAVAEMERARELEPLNLIQGAHFAAVLLYAHQFDASLEQARRISDLDPAFVIGKSWLCFALNAKEMYAESLAVLEKTPQTDALLFPQASYAYAKMGQRQQAKEVISRWREIEKSEYVLNYWIAVVYAALGEKDAAFAELEKAYQAHDFFFHRLPVDPFLDPLRDDPRFQEMLKRLHLPE